MLDVHIAESFEAATRNHPEFGIDVDVHAVIFSSESVPIDRYPLLMRMRDYYGDASFSRIELPALALEIQSLIDSWPTKKKIVALLKQLHVACEQAISTQQNLYLICD